MMDLALVTANFGAIDEPAPNLKRKRSSCDEERQCLNL
jgi:hypothetical protein